jgi:hypothetical protein
MKVLWWMGCMLLCACNVQRKADLTTSRNEEHLQDSLRVHFMRLESEVYGDFVPVRTFHLGLLQEIQSLSNPYLELDTIFKQLHEEADSVIIQRLHFDARQYSHIDQLLQAVQYHHVEYSFYKVKYDQICAANGIERHSLRHFGEVINAKIESWNDSLEEAGRIMARCKTHLRNTAFKPNSKEYIQAYQPISQLELEMKHLSASIMQLQNAESRFVEANVEEYYYVGPNLRPRREILATEGIVSEIALHMMDIHKWQNTYYSQYTK